LRERGLYKRVVDQGRGFAVEYPALWANLSATPLRAPSPAPHVDEHGAYIRQELTTLDPEKLKEAV
jgi:crotonobetainyl-CoA:carnitine CoA-transferase CaiB-like acyl-CoA transferase